MQKAATRIRREFCVRANRRFWSVGEKSHVRTPYVLTKQTFHGHTSPTHIAPHTRALGPSGPTHNTEATCRLATKWSYRTETAPEDSLTHKNTAEPPNFGRANPREGSWDRRGPERHLARAGGGPRTGLDSRPPAARLSLQYGRYSLPRWSSSLISTPNLDDGVFCNRSELVRIHCTYSYTHFNGKPGALGLRSDETTVPFDGTFRTGVGRGCGSAGEAALPSPRNTPPAPRLFMNGRRPYWMNRVHGAVGRYFRGRERR